MGSQNLGVSNLEASICTSPLSNLWANLIDSLGLTPKLSLIKMLFVFEIVKIGKIYIQF